MDFTHICGELGRKVEVDGQAPAQHVLLQLQEQLVPDTSKHIGACMGLPRRISLQSRKCGGRSREVDDAAASPSPANAAQKDIIEILYKCERFIKVMDFLNARERNKDTECINFLSFVAVINRLKEMTYYIDINVDSL